MSTRLVVCPCRYIVGFYRTEQKTVWDSVRTLFVLHNETGNVWTHFLGVYMFCASMR